TQHLGTADGPRVMAPPNRARRQEGRAAPREEGQARERLLAGSPVAILTGMAQPWRVPEPDSQKPKSPRAARLLAAATRALARLSRWVLWTAAAIVVLLILVWILSYTMDGPLTRYMQRQVNDRLKGYTAAVGRAHFNPFAFSVTLHDVWLRQDAH